MKECPYWFKGYQVKGPDQKGLQIGPLMPNHAHYLWIETQPRYTNGINCSAT